MARPTKKTHETIAKLERAIKAGVSRRVAALYAGISYDTLKEWCRDDEQFSTQLNAQEADGIIYHAEQMRGCDRESGPQVSASKFYLSTRRHDAWVTKQATEVTGNLTVAQVAQQAAAQDKIKRAMEGEE